MECCQMGLEKTSMISGEERSVFRTILPWKILIVDTDEELHRVARLTLGDRLFSGNPVEVISAYSSAESKSLLNTTTDIALAIISISLEDEESGLDLVRYIRGDLKDKLMQVILRTDLPDQLCSPEMMLEFDINDLRTKTESTPERLMPVVAASLRAYSLYQQLEVANKEIERQVRFRTEELLEAKEAAEYNLRQRSNMLAHITHDLRSPLGGILGLSQILAMGGGDPEEQEEICNTISDSCEHLLELVNNVLDFSKIESGEFTITKVRYNLRNTINSISQLMSPLALQKGLLLKVRYGPNIPEVLEGDPTRLKQILQNLVGNAIKFTETGEVRIRVHMDNTGVQSTLIIYITDTGIGIAAEEQHVIFERFKQVDEAQGDAGPGSGLGLFITKHLVNLMGGVMNLHSEPGKGTTFAIRLPVERQIVSDAALERSKVQDGVRINLIDTATADSLRRKLISWGFIIKDHLSRYTPNEPSISRTVAIFDQATFTRILNSKMADELNQYLAIIWVKTGEIPHSSLDLVTIPIKTLLLPLRTFAIADACDEFLGTAHKRELSQREHSSIWPSLKLKLIVIDENPTDLQLMQIFLQKLKCSMKVMGTTSALESIPHLESFHAILLSCNVLKQRPSLPGLPIIVCSESGAANEDYSQFSPMVEGVLEKPIQPSKLIPLLDHFIATNQLSKTQTFSIH